MKHDAFISWGRCYSEKQVDEERMDEKEGLVGGNEEKSGE